MTERLVVLLDMDCFYVQVEERHYPHIKGLPAAVVQYNSWKGGGIIAVNYEARAFNVKRGMRGDEARSKCSNIELVTVPVSRGKADLTRYRDAGKEVINVLCDYSDCVERASIDEAYIDFTAAVQERLEKHQEKITADRLKSTWVVGHDEVTDEMTADDKEEVRRKGVQEWLDFIYGDEEGDEKMGPATDGDIHPKWDDLRLAHTAVLCEEMRAAVLERTGFKCSAGIAHNKMLGKLSCGLHKPNQQTVIPQHNVESLWSNLPVGKVRNLGGKLGDSVIEDLACNTMGDLGKLSLQQLMGRFENKTAQWLYNLGKGIDTEPVTSRQLPKSIGCGKNFQGREALNTQEKVQKWMYSLAEELSERLELDQTSNKRRAKTLTVSVRLDGDARFTSMSRSSNLPSYCAERITRAAISLIQHTNKASSKSSSSWLPAIKNISLSAGKFEDWTGSGSADIQEMFKKARLNHKNNQKESDPESTSQSNGGVVEVTTIEDLQTRRPRTSEFQMVSPEKSETVPNKSGQSKTSPKKSYDYKTSPIVSNSFFRNLLQKREIQKTRHLEPECSSVVNNVDDDDVKSDPVFHINNAESDGERIVKTGPVSHAGDAESDSESVENDNLDLLVSFLSDEEATPSGGNGEGGVESDDSIYDAATDVDLSGSSEVPRRIQLSQDLFAEDEVVEVSNAKRSRREICTSGPHVETHSQMQLDGISSHSSIDTIAHITLEKPSPKENRSPLESKDVERTHDDPKILVKELFPDLDNIDESLLTMLPKELQLEVEKALREHKSKSHQQRKSGLWKYVTSIPSPQNKDAERTCKKTLDTSVTDGIGINEPQPGPSRLGMSEEHSSSTGAEYAVEDSIQCLEGTSDLKGNVNNSKHNAKDVVECEECGLEISAFEMPEHADYHVALCLQTDMRREANLTHKRIHERNSGVKIGKSARGKKKKIVNGRASLKDTKIQKLDSFFKH